MTLKETVEWLSLKTIEEKILFNELLLSDLTVMNRAIWDDSKTTDKTKIECLKWSNELNHRIWNLLFELKRGEDKDSENRLADNINFYRKQSEELGGHLGATIKGAVNRYNYIKEK
jgi:hypothetical protein